MYRCLVGFLIGTAFLSVTSGFLSINFPTCSNGKTSGVCTCSEGKVMAKISNRYLCFERSDACPNGFLDIFNRCKCFAGAEDSEGSCLKICSNCDNGWCSSSEKCECNQGFEMSQDSKCEPVCESACPKNGFCSAPGVCACNEGYKMTENNEKCEPICETACPENAICSGPNVCSCNGGYAMSENMENCEPICEEKCSENGFCSLPGTCSCNKGYLKSEDNYCRPDCEGLCPDRQCVAPGECECPGGLIIYGLCLSWQDFIGDDYNYFDMDQAKKGKLNDKLIMD